MPKSIAIDVRLAGTGGGISRYIDGMVEHIAKHAGSREIVLYGTQEHVPYDVGPYHRLGAGFLPYYALHLPNALKRDRIDALFAPSAFLPLRHVCRTVAVLHDLYALKYRSLLARSHYASLRGLAYAGRARFHIFALRYADTIVCVSESTARDLSACSRPLTQIQEIVYEDVPQKFQEAELNRERFILYVGGFNTHKNVATLVRAHACLNDIADEPVRLVLAGYHGWPPIDLDGIIASSGWGDLVTVEHRPSDERIIDLYQRCGLFAYLSAYEGFGLPVLEAIRCGAPVLVNDVSSLPELAPFEQCRVGVESVDAVARAMHRLLSADQSQLVRKLQEHSRKFSFDSAAKRVVQLLCDASVVK